MDVGLIGLPRSGKTTIFNLMTGSAIDVKQFGRTESHKALAEVPDERLLHLAEMFHPKKVTPAKITVVDVPGLSQKETGGPNRFLNDVRLVDALVHVVRGFASELDGAPHPLSDLEDMELELGLADLDALEKRRQKLSSGKKVTKEAAAEMELIGRLIEGLEEGRRLTEVELSEEEERTIRGYQFLTLKPMVWVINLDEEGFKRQQFPDQPQITALAEAKNLPLVTVAGALEEEIAQLGAGDREVFLEDLGVESAGLARLAQAIYHRLGLISFLTAGEDEVRAWSIPEGISAKQAAGKIHSDIERGFIRAEVVAYPDLIREGTMAKAREAGLVRLEGRDYPVADGDIINFRFNV